MLKSSNDRNPILVGHLLEHFYEINEGIEYKPYHCMVPSQHIPTLTPVGRGAQQPGMTGQVKEDILSRFGELESTRNGNYVFTLVS